MAPAYNFFQQLNDSKWRGSVAEVGIGVPFMNEMLNIGGASKTLIYGSVPYSRSKQLWTKGSSVNAASAHHLAASMLNESWVDGERPPLFGVGFTGTHAGTANHNGQRGQTHGWLAIHTVEKGSNEKRRWECHFWMQPFLTREVASERVAATMRWFLSSILLGHPWSTTTIPAGVNVDVLQGPGIELSHQLLLLSKFNPLFFHNGMMDRAVNKIRKTTSLYAGSFNPPTVSHMGLGGGLTTLYILGRSNSEKSRMSDEDLAHRITMCSDVLGLPILVTDGLPKFIEIHAVLSHLGLPNGVQYIQGVDTFNRMVRDDGPSAFNQMRNTRVKFAVSRRNDERVNISSETAQSLEYEEFDINYAGSSSEVREGNLSLVDPRIAAYIEKNGLYSYGNSYA